MKTLNKLQIKLKELNQMLVDDGYNGSNIVTQTLEEIRELAINYTPCCTETKGHSTDALNLLELNIEKENTNSDAINDPLFKWLYCDCEKPTLGINTWTCGCGKGFKKVNK